MLPGIGDLGQGGRASERRTSRHVTLRVRRPFRFDAHADESPLDNVSLAGSAASDRIGHALFSTDLILVQVAFSDRHLNCQCRWHDANRDTFPLATDWNSSVGNENQNEESVP